MGQFYDNIWDEDRVFLFLYYKKYHYEERDDAFQPKVSQIREKSKSFDKDGITNEQFKQHFIDLEYCTKNGAEVDEIYIQQGIVNDIIEKVDEIYDIFLSSEFVEFLLKQPMFDEKRIILDYINKNKRNPHANPPSTRKFEFIEFLVNHFYILADLFLQHKGKFIF